MIRPSSLLTRRSSPRLTAQGTNQFETPLVELEEDPASPQEILRESLELLVRPQVASSLTCLQPLVVASDMCRKDRKSSFPLLMVAGDIDFERGVLIRLDESGDEENLVTKFWEKKRTKKKREETVAATEYD
ncbi:hypothetical protein Tco_0072739 [Tanacetum coccineum]